MDRRKRNIIIMGILVLVLSSIGFTYAIWNSFSVQQDSNTLASSCFQISFEEFEDFQGITLQKAHPITEEEGKTLKPYKFKVTNKCQDYASYEIHLEIDKDSTLSDYNAIRVSLDDESFLLGSKNEVQTTLDTAQKAFLFTTGYLDKGDSKEYELRMWVDEEADSSVSGGTFLSQVTLTASYIEEDKVPPIANLELAVCENNILARGSGITIENKSITQYEFQIDEQNWVDNGEVNTQEFTELNTGNHTIKLKVHDNKGYSSEISKTVKITYEEPTTVTLGGKEINLVTAGNGLYKVSHCWLTETIDNEGFSQDEYRYAGVNYTEGSTDYVHNYVTFNDEKAGWRIIGLVNVMTSSGQVEQRLKIIKNDKLEVNGKKSFSWVYGDTSTYGSDWTKALLMKMLNEDYYNSASGTNNCHSSSSSSSQCDFSTNGIHDLTRQMIAEDIIWNIGGHDLSTAKVAEMYNDERGTNVYQNRSITWPRAEDKDTKARIGLMYASDYGYATGGKSRSCIKNKNLYIQSNLDDYSTCTENNWLYFGDYEWVLTPLIDINYNFIVLMSGAVGVYNAQNSYMVRPTLYLKPNVHIVEDDGDGSKDHPYNLEIVQE